MKKKVFIFLSFQILLFSLSLLDFYGLSGLLARETGLRNAEYAQYTQSADTMDPFWVETQSSLRLFKDMDNTSSVIIYIPTNETVEVFEEIGDYYSASYDGQRGYIFKSKVKPLNFAYSKNEPEGRTKNNQGKDKYSYLLEKYDKKTADALYAHKVWKGMSTQMALDSWGYPKTIDRYMGDEIRYEQWNYSKYTLIFGEGKLIQWKKK